MPEDKIKLMCQRFKKLSFADYTFQQTKAFAEHIKQKHLPPDNQLLTPHLAGLAVTYAKNFSESQGMGALPSSYCSLPDPKLQHTHDRLIQSRNQLYAHRDVIASQNFIYDNQDKAGPYAVKLCFSKKSGLTLHPIFPELNPDILTHIIELCDFQRGRILGEIKKLLPALTQGKKYKEDYYYTIGEDFP